jgi:CRISPR/Cas system-associated protein Csm6
MSDQIIRIAGTPVDVDNLARYLSEQLAGQPVSMNKKSTDRDVSILAIVISTATASATLVFNLLKEYLTKKLIKPDTRDAKAILAKDGNRSFSIA